MPTQIPPVANEARADWPDTRNDVTTGLERFALAYISFEKAPFKKKNANYPDSDQKENTNTKSKMGLLEFLRPMYDLKTRFHLKKHSCNEASSTHLEYFAIINRGRGHRKHNKYKDCS